MKRFKYTFMFLGYFWLRFDPILRLAFKDNWAPRYEFLAAIFGETDARDFLEHRVKLVKTRNKQLPPVVLANQVNQKTNQFLKLNPATAAGRAKRRKIIDTLIFWATDPEINHHNIESYQTRSAIVDSFLNQIFNNSLLSESASIFKGLEKIVFSRATYLGSKGEPSPIVHDVIISGVGRLLTQHFNEIIRQRDEKLDKLTKIKLIKEIKKADKETGSLAFSADSHRADDAYQNKFPLKDEDAHQLLKILDHYRFSAWSESRDRAIALIEDMEKQLGFKISEL